MEKPRLCQGACVGAGGLGTKSVSNLLRTALVLAGRGAASELWGQREGETGRQQSGELSPDGDRGRATCSSEKGPGEFSSCKPSMQCRGRVGGERQGERQQIDPRGPMSPARVGT